MRYIPAVDDDDDEEGNDKSNVSIWTKQYEYKSEKGTLIIHIIYK